MKSLLTKGLCQAQLVSLQEINLHVLLVDDDTALSEMLTEYLSGEGIRTTAAFNGPDGAAAALSGQFDVVVLDVMLPGMDGNEVLRHIRRSSEIPVIMLTAKGGDVDRVVGLEMGADDYIAKPYFPRELVARLRAVHAAPARQRPGDRPSRSGSWNCRRASAKSAGTARPSN